MIKITSIKPMFTAIVTTMAKYENDELINGLIQHQAGQIKEWQTVLAKGPQAQVNVGDKVMLDVKRLLKPTHSEGKRDELRNVMTDKFAVTVDFDVVTINGEDCLLLQDRDIAYVFEGEEVDGNSEELKKTKIIKNTGSLIL